MSTSSSLPPAPPVRDLGGVLAGNRRHNRRLVAWWLTGVSAVVLAVVSCALALFYPRPQPLAQLSAGECVDDAIKGAEALANGDGPDGLHVVPCFQGYDGSIYATGRVPGDVPSDPAAVRKYALEFCKRQPFGPIDGEMAAFVPNADQLANGDRSIVCVDVGAVRGA